MLSAAETVEEKRHKKALLKAAATGDTHTLNTVVTMATAAAKLYTAVIQ